MPVCTAGVRGMVVLLVVFCMWVGAGRLGSPVCVAEAASTLTLSATTGTAHSAGVSLDGMLIKLYNESGARLSLGTATTLDTTIAPGTLFANYTRAWSGATGWARCGFDASTLGRTSAVMFKGLDWNVYTTNITSMELFLNTDDAWLVSDFDMLLEDEDGSASSAYTWVPASQHPLLYPARTQAYSPAVFFDYCETSGCVASGALGEPYARLNLTATPTPAPSVAPTAAPTMAPTAGNGTGSERGSSAGGAFQTPVVPLVQSGGGFPGATGFGVAAVFDSNASHAFVGDALQSYVHVFRRNEGSAAGWVYAARYSPAILPRLQARGFGRAIDISSGVSSPTCESALIVGAPTDDAVYTFCTNNSVGEEGGRGGWESLASSNSSEQKRLAAADTTGYFGSAVSVDGPSMLVGDAYNSGGYSYGTGTIVFYTFDAAEHSGWVASTTVSYQGGAFGHVSILRGTTAVVSQPNANFYKAGFVYVYANKRKGVWVRKAKLRISGVSASVPQPGAALALSADEQVLVITDESGGALYVFERGADQSSWTQVWSLPRKSAFRSLGRSAAIVGTDLIFATAPFGTLGTRANSTLHVLRRSVGSSGRDVWARKAIVPVRGLVQTYVTVSADGRYALIGGEFEQTPYLLNLTCTVGTCDCDHHVNQATVVVGNSTDSNSRLVDGLSVCSLCAPGTAGNTTQGMCRLCAAGTFSNAWGLGRCRPCGGGQYVTAVGKQSCQKCAVNRYSPSQRSASCSRCPSGKLVAAGLGVSRGACTKHNLESSVAVAIFAALVSATALGVFACTARIRETVNLERSTTFKSMISTVHALSLQLERVTEAVAESLFVTRQLEEMQRQKERERAGDNVCTARWAKLSAAIRGVIQVMLTLLVFAMIVWFLLLVAVSRMITDAFLVLQSVDLDEIEEQLEEIVEDISDAMDVFHIGVVVRIPGLALVKLLDVLDFRVLAIEGLGVTCKGAASMTLLALNTVALITFALVLELHVFELVQSSIKPMFLQYAILKRFEPGVRSKAVFMGFTALGVCAKGFARFALQGLIGMTVFTIWAPASPECDANTRNLDTALGLLYTVLFVVLAAPMAQMVLSATIPGLPRDHDAFIGVAPIDHRWRPEFLDRALQFSVFRGLQRLIERQCLLMYTRSQHLVDTLHTMDTLRLHRVSRHKNKLVVAGARILHAALQNLKDLEIRYRLSQSQVVPGPPAGMSPGLGAAPRPTNSAPLAWFWLPEPASASTSSTAAPTPAAAPAEAASQGVIGAEQRDAQRGPFSSAEMRAKCRAGELTAQSKVRIRCWPRFVEIGAVLHALREPDDVAAFAFNAVPRLPRVELEYRTTRRMQDAQDRRLRQQGRGAMDVLEMERVDSNGSSSVGPRNGEPHEATASRFCICSRSNAVAPASPSIAADKRSINAHLAGENALYLAVTQMSALQRSNKIVELATAQSGQQADLRRTEQVVDDVSATPTSGAAGSDPAAVPMGQAVPPEAELISPDPAICVPFKTAAIVPVDEEDGGVAAQHTQAPASCPALPGDVSRTESGAASSQTVSSVHIDAKRLADWQDAGTLRTSADDKGRRIWTEIPSPFELLVSIFRNHSQVEQLSRVVASWLWAMQWKLWMLLVLTTGCWDDDLSRSLRVPWQMFTFANIHMPFETEHVTARHRSLAASHSSDNSTGADNSKRPDNDDDGGSGGGALPSAQESVENSHMRQEQEVEPEGRSDDVEEELTRREVLATTAATHALVWQFIPYLTIVSKWAERMCASPISLRMGTALGASVAKLGPFMVSPAETIRERYRASAASSWSKADMMSKPVSWAWETVSCAVSAGIGGLNDCVERSRLISWFLEIGDFSFLVCFVTAPSFSFAYGFMLWSLVRSVLSAHALYEKLMRPMTQFEDTQGQPSLSEEGKQRAKAKVKEKLQLRGSRRALSQTGGAIKEDQAEVSHERGPTEQPVDAVYLTAYQRRKMRKVPVHLHEVCHTMVVCAWISAIVTYLSMFSVISSLVEYVWQCEAGGFSCNQHCQQISIAFWFVVAFGFLSLIAEAVISWQCYVFMTSGWQVHIGEMLLAIHVAVITTQILCVVPLIVLAIYVRQAQVAALCTESYIDFLGVYAGVLFYFVNGWWAIVTTRSTTKSAKFLLAY